MKVELQNNILFKNVGQQIFQSDILKRRPTKINSGTVIFSKGLSVTSLYLLIEGKINFIDYNFMNRRKDDNKSRIILAGDFFGYEEIDTDGKRTSAAITLTECKIFEIKVDELNSLITQDRQLLNNLNREDTGMQPAETDPEQKKGTTKENNYYFDFRTKVDFVKEKQKNNKAEIGKIEKLKESLQKEKEFTEKAMSKEMSEISNKENELKKLAVSLELKKKLSETSLSNEISELEQKELKIKLLEDSITKKKEKTQTFISEKEEEIKSRESELNERASKIEREEIILDKNLKKLVEIEEKEANLQKKSEELSKEKEKVSEINEREGTIEEKMDSISDREAELEYRDANIEEERKISEENLKKIDEIAEKQEEFSKKQETINEILTSEERIKEREKEQSLLEREKKLSAQSENLDKEKQFAEKALKTEFNNIEKREKELSELEEKLKLEKETYELEFQKEREELLEKIKRNESVNTEKPEDKKFIEEELKKIKQREEDLAKREEALKREMELSEASLQKEVEDLFLMEQEIEEKLAMIVNSEKSSGTVDLQLEKYRKREEELLAKIYELEKGSKHKDAMSDEKEPAESSEPESEEKPDTVETTESEKVESDSEEEPGSGLSSDLERDYRLAFHVQNYEDVAVVFVNIQRGVAGSALKFKHTLDKLLNDGRMKIVVDLSFCDFLDSTFLGVLVTLLKKLNVEGGSLIIVLNKIKISSSTFFLSGMDRVFNIQTDLKKAIHEILIEDS